MLHPHAHLAAQRVRQPFTAGRRADGAVQQGRPQPVEKPPGHALALHQAHGARVAVGLDGLGGIGAVFRDGRQTRSDVAQGDFPTHPLELASAFGARAFEGMQNPLRVVGALGIARHLGAQRAAGVRVIGVALHLDGDAVLHRGDQGTGVRAVVRAGPQHPLGLLWVQNKGGIDHGGVSGFWAAKGNRADH